MASDGARRIRVVRWVADDGLVKVTNLDVDLALGIGHRTRVADVAVAADPDGRAFGQAANLGLVEPVVERRVLPRTLAWAEQTIWGSGRFSGCPGVQRDEASS
jgi:hypothetical protein